MTDYSSCVRHPRRRRSRPHHDTGCQLPVRPGRELRVTSVNTTFPDQVNTLGSAAPGCSIRLSLKPSSGSARGALDGAWWPRSTDPAMKLVALGEELEVRCAQVGLGGQHRAWAEAMRSPTQQLASAGPDRARRCRAGPANRQHVASDAAAPKNSAWVGQHRVGGDGGGPASAADAIRESEPTDLKVVSEKEKR